MKDQISQLIVRLPKEKHKSLKKIAIDKEMSVNTIVRELIDRYLEENGVGKNDKKAR